MKSTSFFSIFAAVLLATITATAQNFTIPQKKLIHFGWNTPGRVAHYQRPLNELTEDAPFDGVGIWISVDLKRDGKTITYNFGSAKGAPQMIYKEDFNEWIPAIRRLQQTRLKYNFIRSSSCLMQADWFDDEAWKRSLNNFGMLAYLAKESGCQGISLDIEAYGFSGKPLLFRPELGHTFEETAAQVRKRAAEWITELNRQFPDLTLFTFFWTSQCASLQQAMHSETQNASDTGLQIAFFNGVYDAAPPTMKIVDGNEGAGYHAATLRDYERISSNYRRFGHAWIDQKNQDKFRKITQLGYSLYMDSYVPRANPGSYNLFTKSDNPTKLLEINMKRCLDFSDEYVWMWAEKGTFWPKITGSKNVLFWNERLPYTQEAIEFALNGSRQIEKYVEKENILVNGTLDNGVTGEPEGPNQGVSGVKGWPVWQAAASDKGFVTAENGMVRFRAISNAAISQRANVKLKGGDRYYLTARCKLEKNTTAVPGLTYFFRDKNGIGLWHLTGSTGFGKPDKDGWVTAALDFTIPDDPDIATMTVSLGAHGAGKGTPADDKGLLFDEAALYRFSLPWDNLPKPVVK